MSFPDLTDIAASTIESRSKKIADNVSKNNALLSKLKEKGRIKYFSGGSKILQELSFAENSNAGWYSGYDLLPVAAQDVISAAEFSIKQVAVPVVISGLELLQNNDREKMIDLMEARIEVAENTMANYISMGLYSDGTTFGGKTITGLGAAVVYTQTGTYGGIDRSAWSFWQNQYGDYTSYSTAALIQASMNALYAKCVRGKDHTDLILFDNTLWAAFTNSLQLIQRFTDSKMADLGFASQKFMNADVVLDGGIGGGLGSSTAIPTSPYGVGRGYFLNTDYLHFRPHKDRDMVALSPNRRYAINQDAEVAILAWAGNLTCSGAQFQGYYRGASTA